MLRKRLGSAASSAAAATLAVAVSLGSCKPNPADCYERGDEKACIRLCDTGEKDHRRACYELRARSVAACVDGDGDCKKACADWTSSAADESIRELYVAKLGSGARVKAIEKKCGSADAE